jgi:hypothetical protein
MKKIKNRAYSNNDEKPYDIYERLAGIQKMLMGAHHAGLNISSATKGNEREHFIDQFLSQILPPIYRFGTGDAVDSVGRHSGQLDVVIEYPILPSLPLPGTNSPRFYLAEGIVAVIEVKSNISSQWEEALYSATCLAPLLRDYGYGADYRNSPGLRIPMFVVGYTGWKTLETIQNHLKDGPVDGVLVIDEGLFASSEDFNGIYGKGAWSLWALICCLHLATTKLKYRDVSPLYYLKHERSG